MLHSYAARSLKVALVLAVFSAILVEWAEYTGGVSRINYCLLVPALAAILAWSVIHDWSPIHTPDSSGIQLGYACLGLSGLLLIIGSLASIFTVSIAGFPFAAMGLIALFWGKEGLFRLRYALLMFFAIVPVPLPILDRLTPGMVRATGAAAVAMVSPFDSEAAWVGADLTYRGWTLVVAEACSGSGTLLVLGTLTLFMAGMFRMSTKAVVITLLLVGPITLFINGLRIAVMAWVLDGFGPAAVTGVGHEIVGQLIVIGGAGALALAVDKMSPRSQK